MRAEEAPADGEALENPAPVAGDVIGDTAYSERFVLKILLKFVNLDTLKEEIKEKAFEKDLCTLCDMTLAQHDVVLFMQKHDALNLFRFALPIVDSPRMIEIIIGIIGNMCCWPEAAHALVEMEGFLKDILEYMKTDDSMTVVQVLRLVTSSLYVGSDDDLPVWMKLFKSVEYSTALNIIMKNSTHKELLITSVGNLNTIASYCNVKESRTEYFTLFVTQETMDALSTAFTKILSNEQCGCYERERLLFFSLQIVLNFIGFEKSPEIFSDSKECIVEMISNVIYYFEDKLVNQRKIDNDLLHIVDFVTTIVNVMQLNEITEAKKYLTPSLNIWKTVRVAANSDRNECSFEDDEETFYEFTIEITPSLATFIGSYIAKCSEENLIEVLDKIGSHYEDIVSSITDENIKANVLERTANHRSRLNDNVQSQ